MSGAPLRNLAMFKKLCGQDCFRNVVLITTMWDEVDGQEGSLRRRELERKFWGSMIRNGSRMLPFHNTKESAWEVIAQLGGSKQPLLIQDEMVNQGKPFSATSAGRVVFDWLEDLIAFIQRLVANRRTRHADPSTLDEEDVANLRKLDSAKDQVTKLTSCTKLVEEPGFLVDSDPRSPALSASPDRRRSTIYGHHLLRLGSRSPSTLSLASSIQSEDDLQMCDTALQATVTALKLVSDLADMAPVPGLKGAVSTALHVAELVAVSDTSLQMKRI